MASKSKGRTSRTVPPDSNVLGGGKRSVFRQTALLNKDDERPSLAYKVLSASATKKLMEADDVTELEQLVMETFEIKDPRIDLKAAAMLDHYVGAIWWCKQQSFSAEQTSAFFTVIDTLTSNIEKKNMSLGENVMCLKKLMSGVGYSEQLENETPEAGGLQTLFDVIQAKNIITFIHSSLFQHHRLYELMFHAHQSDHVISECLPVETAKSADAPWPPPLCEAVTLSVYDEHCVEKVPESEVEEDGQLTSDSKDEQLSTETTDADIQKEVELFSKLTPQQIEQVIEEVCQDMLNTLEADVAAKLRKKENDFITKINQLKVVSSR